VIVACFGMNDGNYFPWDEERFKAFQRGIRELIAKTKAETKARLVLLTPPPYDAYRRLVLDPEAKTFGYKYPAIDYDDVLARYGAWLMTLHGANVLVADVHTRMNAYLRERRAENVSFHLAADGIHPKAEGHWVLARTLLAAWQAPPFRAGETEQAVAALEHGAFQTPDMKRVLQQVHERLESEWNQWRKRVESK
jgi:lysophospholipase L1-like esterase